MTHALNQYLMNLRARNYSAHTLRAYGADLVEYERFLDGRTLSRLEISRFTALLAERLDRISIVRHMEALKSFLIWQEVEGYLAGELSDAIICGKRPKRLQDVPSVEDVRHLLTDFDSARNKAILMLLYATGIRNAELCRINICDLEGEDTILIHGKGNKQRRVLYAGAARRAVQVWLREREKEGRETDALFFSTGPNYGLGRLDVRTIVRIIKQQAENRGFSPEAWYPHILRHAFGCHCLDRGMALEAISQLLGHARLSTTVTYTQVATSRMIESYTKHHPHGAGTMPLSDAG